MFGLVVRFVCRDEEAAAAFDELTAETLEHIRRTEPGTLLYVAHAVKGQPLQRVFYELYRDRAAFEEHEAQDHVKAFLAQRAAHLESFEVDFVTPVASKGIAG